METFKATLKMNDTEYAGAGESIEEAILACNPPFFKTFAYLTVEKENKKAELKFGAFQCKRLFESKIVREIKCEQFRRLLV